MGKPKAVNRRARGKSSRKPEQAYSIDQILERAEGYMDECKYELAQKFCQRALEIDADHVKALELSGSLLLECGEVERAQQCLGRAVHLQPELGHTKYLTLAQLFAGNEARDLYLKGAELIGRQLESGHNSQNSQEAESQAKELTRELSTAYVSVSELYMTDLCDAPEAESETVRYIQLAIQADGSNPEAHQALANYQVVTGKIEEAKVSMNQSLALWLPNQLAFLESGEGEETTLSYSSRLNAAKLLLDLEDFDNATKVLESLLDEDDEVVATWYLLGWLNFLRNDSDYHGNVRYYMRKAKEVNKISPTDDKDLLHHVDEVLAEVGEGPDGEGEVEDEAARPEALAEADLVAKCEEVDRIADLLDQEADEDQEEDDQKMEL